MKVNFEEMLRWLVEEKWIPDELGSVGDYTCRMCDEREGCESCEKRDWKGWVGWMSHEWEEWRNR